MERGTFTREFKRQAKVDVFDSIECFYNPKAKAFDVGLSQSDGVRKAG